MRLSAHRSNMPHRDGPAELRGKQGTRIEVELRPDEVEAILNHGTLSETRVEAIMDILRTHHSNGRQRVST